MIVFSQSPQVRTLNFWILYIAQKKLFSLSTQLSLSLYIHHWKNRGYKEQSFFYEKKICETFQTD